MAIANFNPELWAAAVEAPLEKALVFGQPTVANRKYEGIIAEQGDTVNITAVNAPTVRAYDKNTDLTVEDLSDENVKLTVDQGDYFAFRVNDVDRKQAAGDFESPATAQAAYKMKDAIDRHIAGLFYTGVAAENKVGRLTVGAGNVSGYDALALLVEKLDEAGVQTDGRYAVVPPKFITDLRKDGTLKNVSGSGSDETLRNGFVSRILGLDLLVSSNIQKVGGAGASKDDLVIVAGIPDALTYAGQITQTEAIRSEARFADIVRGLQVYGAKITNGSALATATVNFSNTAPVSA